MKELLKFNTILQDLEYESDGENKHAFICVSLTEKLVLQEDENTSSRVKISN